MITFSLLPSSFDEIIRLLTLLGAVLSFFWGIWVWRDKSNKELAQIQAEAERLAESRRIESTKPFLERQLKLYTEATQIAAKIATSNDKDEISNAIKRFWELYWGELALVENKDVELAMVEMGEGLKFSEHQDILKKRSLTLATACRISLDRSWGIHAWSRPDNANASSKRQK